jgi:hypothetical protein
MALGAQKSVAAGSYLWTKLRNHNINLMVVGLLNPNHLF